MTPASAAWGSTRQTALVAAAVVSACFVGIAIAWQHRAAARAERSNAEDRHASALVLARIIAASKPPPQLGETKETASELLASSVRSVLLDHGLSVSLAQKTVEAPQPLAGGEFVTRRARITLDPVQPGQLAGFVADWTRAHPRWLIASLTLTHRSPPPSRTPHGSERIEFRAQLVLERTEAATAEGPL